jgi:hypothetical protein
VAITKGGVKSVLHDLGKATVSNVFRDGFLKLLSSPGIDSKINSASICSPAGRYENPIPTRFLASILQIVIKFQHRSTVLSLVQPKFQAHLGQRGGGGEIGDEYYMQDWYFMIHLKGLSHEMDLAFDDMHGQFKA